MGPAALACADREADRSIRRLWLVAGIDAIVAHPIFLVGGAAVDLHTGSYLPTDVDLVGVVTGQDRQALVEAGFAETGSGHLRWDYPDGQSEFVEFPGSTLDGSFERIRLSDDVMVNVITVESLVVDRMVQATDGSDVTFAEALRLVVAVATRVDWSGVGEEVKSRPDTPYLGTIEKAGAVLVAAGLHDVADDHFAVE